MKELFYIVEMQDEEYGRWLKLVRNGWTPLRYVPPQHISYGLCLAASEASPGVILGMVPFRFRTLELCYREFEKNCHALRWFPIDLLTEEFCVFAINKDYRMMPPENKASSLLFCVPEQLRTEKVCELAFSLKICSFMDFPEHLKTMEKCRIAVMENGALLADVPMDKRTPEICKLATKKYSYTIKHIPDHILTEDFCDWLAENIGGLAFQRLPPEKRTVNRYKLALACAKIGLQISELPHELTTRENCQGIVKSFVYELQFCPPEYIDQELCNFLVEKDSGKIMFIPQKYMTSEHAHKAVKHNGYLLRYLPPRLVNLEICQLAIRSWCSAIWFVPFSILNRQLCELALASIGLNDVLHRAVFDLIAVYCPVILVDHTILNIDTLSVIKQDIRLVNNIPGD